MERVVRGNPPPGLVAVDEDADPLIYFVLEGAMPPGLTLNPDGTWSGGVLGSGTFTLTVETCDPHGACADQVLMITVVSDVALPQTDTAGDLDSGSTWGDALTLAGLVLISLGTAAGLSQCGPRPRVEQSEENTSN